MKKLMIAAFGAVSVSGVALADVPGGGCSLTSPADVSPMGLAAICLGIGATAFMMLRRR